MAMRSTAILLLVAIAAAIQGLAAQSPGSAFPFYDNCRKNTTHQLRNVTALPPTFAKDGTASFCFRINVLQTKCTPEVFMNGKVKVTSRCCNTTFAKIKFYTNSACRLQFAPSPITVPLATKYSKVISPTWEHLDTNYTDIKYTQFGPIPQSQTNGTTFCLTVKPPTGVKGSTCAVGSLNGITSPYYQGLKTPIFQVAIYDRKTNNYECCPTFTFNAPKPKNTTGRRSLRAQAKHFTRKA